MTTTIVVPPAHDSQRLVPKCIYIYILYFHVRLITTPISEASLGNIRSESLHKVRTLFGSMKQLFFNYRQGIHTIRIVSHRVIQNMRISRQAKLVLGTINKAQPVPNRCSSDKERASRASCHKMGQII